MKKPVRNIRMIVMLICCWAILNGVQAQRLTAVSMTPSLNDPSASLQRRMDLTGVPCALVKVQFATPDVGFEGNLIPPVEYKDGVYWVYMTDGSRELRMKHHSELPVFLPFHVSFADFGIAKLKSLTTYSLKVQKENAQNLIIDYTPVTAKVIVDLKEYRGNGHVELDLPAGRHDYRIVEDGYDSSEGSVKLNNRSSRKMMITLERNYSSTQNQDVETFIVKGIPFHMIHVRGGTFQMGEGCKKFNGAHQVTLSDYYVGETEVTQELWQAVMGQNPSTLKDPNLPVDNISWEDCQVFISKLNDMTGHRFRLPTEAEWEFAAHGGNMCRDYDYSGSNILNNVAWYIKNSDDKTHPIKSKHANELGLYDMSGNVWEWCQDWFDEYSLDSQTNPTGPSTGKNRVVRGGCWYDDARFGGCYVTARYFNKPDYHNHDTGFRLAL